MSNQNSDYFLRLDYKYHSVIDKNDWDIFQTKCNNLIPLKNILTPSYTIFEYEDDLEYNGIPTGREYLNDSGDIISVQIVNKDDHPSRLKYKADNNCILISSLKGARIPALNFNFDISSYVFSNGFYIFKVNTEWSKKFVLYLLRTEKIKSLLDQNIFRGIGISAYREEDLLKILIPEISLDIQNSVTEKIAPLETKITNLKNTKLKSKDIINQVFSDQFNIQLSDVTSIDIAAKLKVKLSSISTGNNNLRDSFRWNKMQYIQKHLYKDIDCIHLLGSFIVETKNGWSPLSVDGGEGIPVLGQEHFSFDGVLRISPTKFTEVAKNNIEDYFILQGDFFVSRGNTVDLVALASVVEEEISEDIIFPDLYIKIQLDEARIDKKYLAFLFNSFFGRLYFKYASKGKNQSMVKISSSELYDFYLPIPVIEVQRAIVETIEAQINAQSHIDREIEKNMAKINFIIEAAIGNQAYV